MYYCAVRCKSLACQEKARPGHAQQSQRLFLVIFVQKVFETNLNFSKVLSLLEACFDLISSPSLSMKIQIMGAQLLFSSS